MAVSVAAMKRWAARHAERIVYRVGGLPVASRTLVTGRPSGPAAAIRSAYAAFYWNPEDLADLSDLLVAAVIWPVGLVAAALWFTRKNGRIIHERSGKSPARQLAEQMGAYFSAGILPPWYYMFELHDDPSKAPQFLNRFETKRGIYPLVKEKRGASSPLNDKLEFARRCQAHQVRTVPVIATASNGRVDFCEGERLPPIDLFIKPIDGRGGTGAERWDHADGRYACAGRGSLSGSELLERLREQSIGRPRLVQPRIRNCAELNDLNNGALSTFRIVTCLDELGRPEVVAAVMRMAIGDNHRVDNIHAGGIAAPIDLGTGELGLASNLGTDARLGWVEKHPDSGGLIRGRFVPQWKEACSLAERAHLAFADRAIVGWDIAATADGPIIVEGNAAPDLDLMQRPMRRGLAESRLNELLTYHLTGSAPAADTA